MTLRHFNFVQPNTPFFDTPVSEAAEEFDLAAAPVPDGWLRSFNTDWCSWHREDPALPEQGWKIHVSATQANAAELLTTVADYCFANKVAFKFIRAPRMLLMRNSKYGDRSASGKFMTLYPATEERFAEILEDLDQQIGGQAGPYILSDLRYKAGPLFVRYGGFQLMYGMDGEGKRVPCIRRPDGELVPDLRKPVFRPPEWITMPACLTESMTARESGTLKDFPYRPRRAFHFSNGGGVYEAVDPESGMLALMKEARPMAGLDELGRDAVDRLSREQWALEQLADLDEVPTIYTYQKGHEHYFLVRELLDGRALAHRAAELNPELGLPTALDHGSYRRWALDILDKIDAALQAFHARGVVFGDVHPGNIFVRPDDTIAFIDYECSETVEANQPQFLGAAGFRAPATHTGTATDRFGLGCLRLSIFCGMTETIHWGGRDKVLSLIDEIVRRFAVPESFRDQVLQDMGPLDALTTSSIAPDESAPGADESVAADRNAAIAAHILGHATPERDDRLYPGDAQQFMTPAGGLGLAYGAAGVILALTDAGHRPPTEHIDWLETAARGANDAGPGLWDGLAGVAGVLDRVGRPDAAREVFDHAVNLLDPHDRPDLFSGAWGVALVALELGRRHEDETFIETALKLADAASAPAERKDLPGLLHGKAGGALVHLGLFEATAKREHLDRAVQLLHEDLVNLGFDGSGENAAPGPWHVPALGFGSAGTFLVLREAARRRPDPVLDRAATAFLKRLDTRTFNGAGLLKGQLGAMLVLSQLAPRHPWAQLRLNQQDFGLEQRTVVHPPGVALLGEMDLRLSCDLATGGAGHLWTFSPQRATEPLPFWPLASSPNAS